jgi:hypothetical protein
LKLLSISKPPLPLRPLPYIVEMVVGAAVVVVVGAAVVVVVGAAVVVVAGAAVVVVAGAAVVVGGGAAVVVVVGAAVVVVVGAAVVGATVSSQLHPPPTVLLLWSSNALRSGHTALCPFV